MNAKEQGFTTEELREVQAANEGTPSALRELLERPLSFSQKERTIMLQTCCGGASEKEAEQLIAIAEARGLNPITGECYFVKRWDSEKQQMVWAVQASIDSFRIKADQTGLYDGQDEPEFEYDAEGVPTLARVRMYRKGWSRPIVGVARYDEYVQRKKDGSVTRFWKNMPHNQLAKCAEALAFRKAFPNRFARVYTPEEMQQAENPHGEISLFDSHAAQLIACNSTAQIRTAAEAIAADVKRHALSPEQATKLRKLAQDRKAAITAPKASSTVTPAAAPASQAASKPEPAKPTASLPPDADSPPPAEVVLAGEREPGED